MVEAFVCQKRIDERSEKMESDSKTTLLAILISLIVVACIFIVAIIYWKTKKRCQKIASQLIFLFPSNIYLVGLPPMTRPLRSPDRSRRRHPAGPGAGRIVCTRTTTTTTPAGLTPAPPCIERQMLSM